MEKKLFVRFWFFFSKFITLHAWCWPSQLMVFLSKQQVLLTPTLPIQKFAFAWKHGNKLSFFCQNGFYGQKLYTIADLFLTYKKILSRYFYWRFIGLRIKFCSRKIVDYHWKVETVISRRHSSLNYVLILTYPTWLRNFTIFPKLDGRNSTYP